MKVTVPSGERHDGTLPDGSSGDGFINHETTGYTYNVIEAKDDYTVVEYAAFQFDDADGYSYGLRIRDASNVTFQYLIVNNSQNGSGLRASTGSNHEIYNNLTYDNEGDGFLFDSGVGTTYVYNNTSVDDTVVVDRDWETKP